MGRMDGEMAALTDPSALGTRARLLFALSFTETGLVIAPAGFKLFLGSPGLNLNFQFPISVSRDLANL